MARPLRIEFPGAVYLVSDTAPAGCFIIQSDDARLQFLADLMTVSANLDWIIYSWCILPDRYNIVVETPHGDLGTGMRRFTSNYTRHVNRQNKRSGRVFRGPYRAVLLEPDVWMLPVCRHVVLQPVASGVVATPEEWPWSSYQATVMSTHVRSAPLAAESLLSRFGRTQEEAVAAYADYIRAGIGQPTPLAHVMPPGILGTQTFVQVVTEHLAGRASEPSVAATLLMLARPTLTQIFEPDARRERSQLPLRVAAAVHLGYSLVQIGGHLGVHYTTVSRYLRAAQGERRKGLPPVR
jgi:REP element-mobilizing transposase RayT